MGLFQTALPLAILALLLVAAGCGGTGSDPSTQTTAAPAGPTIDLTQGGSISGRALFRGRVPARQPVPMDAVPACARQHTKPYLSEEVIVARDGAIQNVFVRVKSGLPPVQWEVPATPVTLDQQACVYTPRVVGIMVGQTVQILNSDPASHNVHAMARANTEFNETQPPRGDPIVKRFSREEVMIPFGCGLHPWMRAYAGVVEHPFFAVTGGKGAFLIKGLPPGEYVLEAWHERFGTREMRVTIGPREEKIADFTFEG